MKLCLCGQSSVEAWRRYDNRVAYTPVFGHTLNAGPTLERAFPSVKLEPGCPISSFTPDAGFVASRDFSRWGICGSEMLHILVSPSARGRRLSNCKLHLLSVPEDTLGLFLEVEPGVCLTSPELTFLTMGQELDLIRLIRLGYEFCGCYSILPECDGGLAVRHPLTSVEAINELVDKVGGIKGIARARRALQYVIDGSGSPQETALAMLMCLPNKYGGFGLPRPQMNLRLDLGRAASTVWSRSNAFDLVWVECKVVIEYDGREGHSTFEQAERDNARRNALVVEGYTVFVITASQLRNVEGFYSIARVVAGKLGHRIRIRDDAFWGKHFSLRDALIGV